MSHEKDFTVEVMRETWSTRTYRVKAENQEAALEKAVEEAEDDDWSDGSCASECKAVFCREEDGPAVDLAEAGRWALAREAAARVTGTEAWHWTTCDGPVEREGSEFWFAGWHGRYAHIEMEGDQVVSVQIRSSKEV